MGFINLAEKTINAKLVYYGVGLGGKTTSLKVVHSIMCPRDEVKLVSINTEQDSTLLFDFLPIDLGQIEGFKIRVQGFTVPGQQKYVVMRKYVLQGADAVVLVVDSRKHLIEDNLQTIADLKKNLEANGLDWRKIPLVIQYNKRDLPDLIDEAELDGLFRFREAPTYLTVATQAKGVFEAFIDVVGRMVEEKVLQYGLGKGQISAKAVADEARHKLEQFLGERHEAATLPADGLVSVSVPDSARSQADAALAQRLPRSVGSAGQDALKSLFPGKRIGQRPERAKPAASETAPPRGDVPAGLTEEAVGLLGQAITSNLELAEIYSELAEYKSLLEKKNRELVEVNQLISHDLKKPLTVFKTVIGLLLKGHLGELSQQQTDAIQNCSESVRYMEELISDIVESSRLDYDGVSFEFAPIDMTLLVGGLVRRLRYHLEDHGVRLRVEPLPVVKCDEKALQKVFMNLIGNAINYRDPDKPQPTVRINAEDCGDHWLFRVADNGIGIPAESLPNIWQKFVRGSNTAGVSGTGLGLYIVQQTVRGHGGQIWAESTLGVGTTFLIRLPKEPSPPEHSPVA